MNNKLLSRASDAIKNIPPETMCYWEMGQGIKNDLLEQIAQRCGCKIPSSISTLFGYPIQINPIDENVFRLWECKAEL